MLPGTVFSNYSSKFHDESCRDNESFRRQYETLWVNIWHPYDKKINQSGNLVFIQNRFLFPLLLPPLSLPLHSSLLLPFSTFLFLTPSLSLFLFSLLLLSFLLLLFWTSPSTFFSLGLPRRHEPTPLPGLWTERRTDFREETICGERKGGILGVLSNLSSRGSFRAGCLMDPYWSAPRPSAGPVSS